MFKGTTPKHTFEVDTDTSNIKEVKIIYSQNDKEVLCKRTTDCTIEPGIISTRLTQEDTFKFVGNTCVSIIIRALTFGGDALITEDPIIVSVRECCDDEVLV